VELGEQLDRLPDDWDALLTDTDPLTTLLVEVAAALVEAGLPLHGAQEGHPSGGVSLLPETSSGGVLVSWRAHDRMSRHDVRGAAATTTVQQSMNAAVADILANLGFVVEPFGNEAVRLLAAPEEVTDPEGAFLGALEALVSGEHLTKTLACRGSTKFGESLTREEMASLLREWADCEFGEVCPHGRLIAKRIPLAELLREFGRI
jgi:hypothetical protein